MAMLTCEKCGKVCSSTSGLTLHKNQCKGPKSKAGPKLVKSVIVAPTTPFHCEGKGVGATLCGELADYRLIYEEDEVEAFAYACTRCRNDLKQKYNPKKIIPIPRTKPVKPERPAPIKIKPEHQKALEELLGFSKDYWRKFRANPSDKSLKEDKQILDDMIEEVSKYPGCEVSAVLCKLGGSDVDW
jgi:hypothetical protein